MDTSQAAIFVNGGMLSMHVHKRVRIVIKVDQSDHGSIIGKSTDDHQIVVKGSSTPSHHNFVEVIGIVDGGKSIQAEVCTNFEGTIDGYSYDELCKLVNGEFKHLFL